MNARGLQAAAASWASLLCVYMHGFNGLSELYAKYLFYQWVSNLVYTVGHLWRGKAPPNAYIEKCTHWGGACEKSTMAMWKINPQISNKLHHVHEDLTDA